MESTSSSSTPCLLPKAKPPPTPSSTSRTQTEQRIGGGGGSQPGPTRSRLPTPPPPPCPPVLAAAFPGTSWEKLSANVRSHIVKTFRNFPSQPPPPLPAGNIPVAGTPTNNDASFDTPLPASTPCEEHRRLLHHPYHSLYHATRTLAADEVVAVSDAPPSGWRSSPPAPPFAITATPTSAAGPVPSAQDRVFLHAALIVAMASSSLPFWRHHAIDIVAATTRVIIMQMLGPVEEDSLSLNRWCVFRRTRRISVGHPYSGHFAPHRCPSARTPPRS